MLTPAKLLGLVAANALVQATAAADTIDATRFSTSGEIRHLADKICGSEPRLPGSDQHLKVVDFIKCQLEGIPGLEIKTGDFDLATWEPAGNSLYQSARLRVGDEKLDVVGAMVCYPSQPAWNITNDRSSYSQGYTLPTNGSYVTGRFHVY